MRELAADLPPDHGGLLVVDDEPFLRDAVAASLRFLGFEVTTADNGTDALRLARDGRFDLVVLDVMLTSAGPAPSSPPTSPTCGANWPLTGRM
jgi:two-component system OmpR family response regulator